MTCFQDFADKSKWLQEREIDDCICTIISNTVHISRSLDHLWASFSFWQTFCVLVSTKKCNGFAIIRPYNVQTISKYALICLCNEFAEEIRTTSFSTDFCGCFGLVNLHEYFYLNTRIFLLLNTTGVIDVHLMAIIFNETSTCEVILEISGNVFHVLCYSWREVAISVLTDRDNEMTVRVSRAASRFQQVEKTYFNLI